MATFNFSMPPRQQKVYKPKYFTYFMGGGIKSVNGIIVSGLGEGAYFMSMPHYKNEIKKKLGFDSYAGTLNIKIAKDCRVLLKNVAQVKISGYKSNGKIFGGASCYKSKINKINGAIIVPDINKHNKKIIEFIAAVHIKSALKLKDGDKIKIIIQNFLIPKELKNFPTTK